MHGTYHKSHTFVVYESFASGATEKKDTASLWWSGTVVSYFLVALLTHVPVEKETVSNHSQGLTWLSDDVQPEGAFVYAANIRSVSARQPD